jgi:hypothetical protein
VKIEFDGRQWELDNTKIMVRDAMVIQLYTGLSIGDWQDSLAIPRDPDAGEGTIAFLNPPAHWLKSVIGLYWLMLAQNDVRAAIDEVDFDYTAFYQTWLNARLDLVMKLRAEREVAAKPDPTSPAPSPPPGPPSPEPATPTATTRKRPAPPLAEAATGS